MGSYNDILLAIDLSSSATEYITKQAAEIAKLNKAKLTILHVVEDINSYGDMQGHKSITDIEEQLFDESRKILANLCER